MNKELFELSTKEQFESYASNKGYDIYKSFNKGTVLKFPAKKLSQFEIRIEVTQLEDGSCWYRVENLKSGGEMNIKELKELIKDLPEDVELYHNEVPDCNYELTASYSEKYSQVEFWVKKRSDQ